MSQFDSQQARQFIELLHGDAETPQYFQVFHDSKKSADTLKQPATFFAKLEDSIDYFNGVMQHNYGVYVTLNKTDGKGRALENIRGYRYVFADLDNTAIPDDLPLKPTFITQRDSMHSHLYWRVDGMVTQAQFERLQKRAALCIGSDKQVFDSSRVVRVAGSYNCKDPANPARYNIVDVNDDKTPYTLAEFEEAFTLSDDVTSKLEAWCDPKQALTEGDGYNDTPLYRTRLINWLERAEPAVEGSGSYTLVKVISMARDYGIPLVEAQSLAWEHYNPRCQPPWEDREQRGFNDIVKRAYTYANNEIGCSTAAANFMRNGDVPEPTGGWEHNRSLRQPQKKVTPAIAYDTTVEPIEEDQYKFISEVNANGLLTSMTSKSEVRDLACAFIGKAYPDGNLMFNAKQFHTFNGRFWETLSDDDMLSEIDRFYDIQNYKFPHAKIKNIFDKVKTRVNAKNLSKDLWLDGSRDGRYTMNLNNVMLCMKGKVEVLQHDRKFFSKNSLDYDYDPTAECPTLIKLLNDIWGEGNPLIDSFQEFLGYCLTSDSSMDKIGLMVGVPRSGKGTLTRMIVDMLGSHNTASPPIATMAKDSTIDAVAKAKLTVIPEATDVHASREQEVLGILKAMSGGDAINYHEMYVGSRSNDVWGKILMVANSMPNFKDSSGALAGRFWTFPFVKSFFGNEDRTIQTRLRAEKSGILNFALKGLLRLQSNNMVATRSPEAEEFTNDVKRDMFALSDFVDDCCVIDADASVSTADIYKGYQYYCKDKENSFLLSVVKFGRTLKSSWYSIMNTRMKDKARSRGLKGIRLNDTYAALIDPTNNVTGFKPVTPVTDITPPPPIAEAK